MRLFLDANVLFSAARTPEGRAAALVTLAKARRCTLVCSIQAMEEARRNLLLKNPEQLGRFERIVARVVLCAEGYPQTVAWAQSLGLPEKDAPILAAAVSARADALVTGDRTHFGHLYGKRLRGVRVASFAEGLRLLLS